MKIIVVCSTLNFYEVYSADAVPRIGDHIGLMLQPLPIVKTVIWFPTADLVARNCPKLLDTINGVETLSAMNFSSNFDYRDTIQAIVICD
jgi:hypothetical protein